MKKIVLTVLLLIFLALACIGIYKYYDDKGEDLTKVTVAEVTHSIFYAPWYIAIEKGYFKDEGLDIDVILTPGADKVAAAVLSGDANIGFSGPEATIYVYDNGAKDYLVTFASLTKRDGQFLVGDCSEKDNFDISNLIGKKVLGGRVGGMPLMVFTYGLKESEINTNKVSIDTSVEFAALSGAYIGGNGDYVNLFEPAALALEKNGYGCVLASIGQLSGEVPYTAYYAKKSYIDKNDEIIEKFNNALNKGLEFVKNNDPEKIAKAILNQFPDTSLTDLTAIVKRYKEADSWWDSTYISEEAYNRLLDIMRYNNALDKDVSFELLTTNKFNK